MDGRRTARIADALGEPDFYGCLLDAALEEIGGDSAQVIAYHRSGPPDYLAALGTPRAVQKAYCDSYYRDCPMNHYWRRPDGRPVVAIHAAQGPGRSYRRYWTEFYRRTGLSDEVGLFLPTAGIVSIVVSVGRRSRLDDGALERAASLYSEAAALHRAHLRLRLRELDPAGPVALLDRYGQAVVASPGWNRAAPIPDQSLPLPDTDPVAPGGFLVVAGKVDAAARLRGLIARLGLTRREAEVMVLILEGLPNAAIAKRLSVTTDAIKGTRKRLYRRLDITCERALFLMVLRELSLQ